MEKIHQIGVDSWLRILDEIQEDEELTQVSIYLNFLYIFKLSFSLKLYPLVVLCSLCVQKVIKYDQIIFSLNFLYDFRFALSYLAEGK